MLWLTLALATAPVQNVQGASPHARGTLWTPNEPPVPHVPVYFEDSTDVQTLLLDGGRSELEIFDVDADGHPDIVSVGDHGSPFINTQQHGVMVWFGDGAGGFTLAQTGNFGYGGVALGDVDGDGLVDVGYGVHHDYSSNDLGDQLLEVALGDGSGTSWTPWDDGLATSGETWGMFGTDFGDVDADGDLDVGSNSFGCCAGVHVYANQGDGTWTQSFGVLGGNSSMDFEFADFNGDGELDALAANSTGKVWFGQGDGTLVAADGNLPTAFQGVSAGDVDDDGEDELALVVGGAPEVWTWRTGTTWNSKSNGLPTSGAFEATDLIDMNADGALDLVAFGNGQLSIFELGPGGSWTSLVSLTTPGSGSKDHAAMRIGDLDHNGYPDVALWQDEGSAFNSRNTFRLFREASTPSGAWIRPVAPSPGRVWRSGQVRFIEWTAALPTPPPGAAPVTVDLDWSPIGPAGPWQAIVEGAPPSGRFQWSVPAGLPGGAAWIRYTLDLGPVRVTAKSAAFAIAP